MTADPHSRWADRSELAGGHLSDAEVATRVRMLMRWDLDHEIVCSMGRDRIMHLSEKSDALEKALRTITNQLKAEEPRYSRDESLIAEAEALLAKLEGRSPQSTGLGYCPICGAPGLSREKRPFGDDHCEAGHSYPSSRAILAKPEGNP